MNPVRMPPIMQTMIAFDVIEVKARALADGRQDRAAPAALTILMPCVKGIGP